MTLGNFKKQIEQFGDRFDDEPVIVEQNRCICPEHGGPIKPQDQAETFRFFHGAVAADDGKSAFIITYRTPGCAAAFLSGQTRSDG
jgi:hypothetical protein